ncbi:MAG: phosphate ABC transporter ATP-binding protein [Anaerolineae bacterium]|nr:phosphate ABC transporter ATP-binding protein [Anaerolineae bacterium]
MSVIEVRDLSLARGGERVLHHVSLSIEEGEVLMVIGPSGGGKSSLLRCLNRLEEPAPDTVFLRGQDITTIPVTTLRCRVGMVFQKTAVFGGTVAENIAYGPRARGKTLSRDEIARLMKLAALDADLIDRPARELSGGQEQRLAVARALANQPEVLLLDEPTSALDPVATKHVEASLQSLREQLGLTMVWVSHAVEQARRVGDRVLFLDEGRVVSVGAAQAMLDAESADPRLKAFMEGQEPARAKAGPGAA